MTNQLTADEFDANMRALGGAIPDLTRTYEEALLEVLEEAWLKGPGKYALEPVDDDYADCDSSLSHEGEAIVQFVSGLFKIRDEVVRLHLSNLIVRRRLPGG